MTNARYNGWTNYETWCVHLWMTNDEASDCYVREQAQAAFDATDEDDSKEDRLVQACTQLAELLETEYEESMPEVSGVWSDLLRTAFDAIDWREIAYDLLSDVK